jgi:hypothetical protein
VTVGSQLIDLGIVSDLPSAILVAFLTGLSFVAVCLLTRLVRLERQIRGTRIELSRLRTRGVEIRNAGMRVPPPAEGKWSWPDWEKAASEWSSDVVAAIQKIDEGYAEWFNILDVVPNPPRVPFNMAHVEHAKLFREHDFRVMRLGELIRELWSTTSSIH